MVVIMTTEIQTNESPTDPWSDLDRALGQTRARFFEAFGLTPFGPAFRPIDGTGAYLRAARVDVTDTGKAYKVVAEIPGIPKEKLDIRVRGTSVEIRGEQSEENEPKEPEYVHRERVYAGFYRALEMPEPVVGPEAKAKVENGLLELELPKVTPTPSPDEVKVAVV
jgi:HSP20 family protein